MRTVFSLLFAVLVVGVLPAQRTWIVDKKGGPGVDFTDIPPAIAAATAGDRIEVRANAQPYTSFTLSKVAVHSFRFHFATH